MKVSPSKILFESTIFHLVLKPREQLLESKCVQKRFNLKLNVYTNTYGEIKRFF